MTSSEENRKCRTCEFTAPVIDWKVYPEGDPFNVICYECRCMQCKVCKYSAPVSTWRIEIDGVKSLRCFKCADGGEFRKCTRCDKEEPLRDWKILRGVPTKWCERCRAWSQKKEQKIKEQKREDSIAFYEHQHGPMLKHYGGGSCGPETSRRLYVEYCIREGIDHVKRDAIIERQQAARNKNYSKCPDCHKPMQITSIEKHQAKACKGVVPAVEVSPNIT
jgi:hypothetical protein